MRLLHTMLRVGDLQRSIDFYTKVLGMKLLRTSENPEYKYYEYDGSITEYSFSVQDGDYIIIDDAPAVFTPYQGKPSLGFK